MKFTRLVSAFVVVFAFAAHLALAQSDSAKQAEIAKKIINKNSVDTYSIWGDKQTNTLEKDATVQGGQARRVVSSGGGKPWDASAHSAFIKPVAKGDQLVAVIWMKCEPNADGSPLKVTVRMEGTSAPYSGTNSEEQTLTTTWKMYQVKGVSPEAFAQNAAHLSISFGMSKGVLWLGPSFVLNMGPTASVSAAPPAPAPVSSKPTESAEAASKFLNKTSVEAYSIWGNLQTNTLEKDATVQGGMARRVVTTSAGKPWDASAHSTFFKPIEKGDQLVAVIWLRCEPNADGSPMKVTVRMEGYKAPYPGTNSVELTPTAEWQKYEVKGISPESFAKEEANLSIQTGSTKGTVWLGPATVLNLGKPTN